MSIIFVYIVQISECSLKLYKKNMLLIFLHSFILSNLYEAEKLCLFSVSLSVDTTKMIYLCPFTMIFSSIPADWPNLIWSLLFGYPTEI